MAEDTSKGVWWHGPLIGGIMSITAGVANYVATHWGGVTAEQFSEQEKRTAAKLDTLSRDVAKAADDTKRYVDQKFEAERAHEPAAVPKKRKVARDQ